MEFRTKVELPVGQSKICHSDLLMSWGSCFSENIGTLIPQHYYKIFFLST